VARTRPALIVHLAAQSLPVVSWGDPDLTFQVNAAGAQHLLDAVRAAGDLRPRIVVAGSSAEYGPRAPSEMPIREDAELRPGSPYGVSKAAMEMLCLLYGRAFGMEIVRVRPFFVIGPRKRGDVCSDFARGVVAIERGRQDALHVGNLEAVRDFVDVQDAVSALMAVIERAQPGEAYNIATGVGHTVQEVLDAFVSLAACPARIEPDPARMRPSDEPIVIGDNTKLKALGWMPRIPFRESLRAILDYWREEPPLPANEA
jgi:GDP-4-dehydro-6-deoxy-D-mannose reductase